MSNTNYQAPHMNNIQNYQPQGYQANPSSGYYYPERAGPNFRPDPNLQIPNQKNSKLKQILNFLKEKKWFILIGALILTILLGVFFVLTNGSGSNLNQLGGLNRHNYDNVKVNIMAPSTLPQGTPGDWEIEIENFESVALSNIKLELDFDTGFQFIQSYNPSPEDSRGRVYTLPRLDPVGGRTSRARVRFQGSLNANIDIETEMGGIISYAPDFGNGQLGELVRLRLDTARTKVTSPQVRVNFEPARSTVQNGNQTELMVVIENISDQEIRNLRLRMIYPQNRDNFTYLSSEYMRTTNTAPITQPDDGDDIWYITRLPAGVRQTLKVRGSVFGSDNIRLTFGVELAIQSPTGSYQPIWTGFRDITIAAQPLLVQTSISGKQSNGLIEQGERLQIEVRYENQSNNTIENVEIFAFLDDPANMLDLSTLEFSGGERGDLSGSELVWRSPRVPNLATVLPRQSGIFRYTVQVRENFIDNRLNQQQYIITPGIRARARNIPEIASTGITYRARGRFVFESPRAEKIGNNQTTGRDIYRITWRLSNAQNEIQEAEVRAILPVVGAWNENTIRPSSARSSISHNENTGEIIWRVGRIESYTGRVRNPIEINFDLEVERNETELLRNLRATGIDVFTGERYQENRGNVGIR